MTPEFLAARITVTEELIALYETAIAFLATNPTASYTIDTGQSQQTVTRVNLASMNKALDSLLNRLVTLEKLQNGGGPQVRPAW